MSEKIRNFRDLDVWKKGIEIVKDVLLEKVDHESRMLRNLVKKLN